MRLLALLLLLVSTRADDWRETLARTPFPRTSFKAYQTEPVELILKAFRPEGELRGVVLMPAAADQLYFFDWGRVDLAGSPSLLDALNALTNKAEMTYSFVAPFLLIHLARDTTSDPVTFAADAPPTLQSRKRARKTFYLDRPYDKILSEFKWTTGLNAIPDSRSPDSYHYYRLAFVGYYLSPPEYIRAVGFGTKTSVRVEKKRVVFQERPFNK
jgi:hypothetical protein